MHRNLQRGGREEPYPLNEASSLKDILLYSKTPLALRGKFLTTTSHTRTRIPPNPKALEGELPFSRASKTAVSFSLSYYPASEFSRVLHVCEYV